MHREMILLLLLLCVCVNLDTVPQNCRISEILYTKTSDPIYCCSTIQKSLSWNWLYVMNLTYRNRKFINRTNMLISKISCNQNSENIQLDYSVFTFEISVLDSFLHSQIFVAFYPFRSYQKVLNPTSSTQFWIAHTAYIANATRTEF